MDSRHQTQNIYHGDSCVLNVAQFEYKYLFILYLSQAFKKESSENYNLSDEKSRPLKDEQGRLHCVNAEYHVLKESTNPFVQVHVMI